MKVSWIDVAIKTHVWWVISGNCRLCNSCSRTLCILVGWLKMLEWMIKNDILDPLFSSLSLDGHPLGASLAGPVVVIGA